MSSGKAKRLRRELRNVSPRLSADFRQVFGGDGVEPITEDLVQELVSRGWPGSELREFARLGFRYSRPRNSLIGPPERFG